MAFLSSIPLVDLMKLQNFGILRNVLGSFRKSLEVVGPPSEILTHRVPQDKNHTPSTQKNLAGIWTFI